MFNYVHIKSGRGFTIFFAMLVGGLALAIGVAIYDLTVRELDLSGTATQSQYAIYAADTGAECALYWDFKCTGPAECTSGGAGNSAFATSSGMAVPPDNSGLLCNGVDVTAAGNRSTVYAPDGSAATTTFTITFLPQPYCATVSVGKKDFPTVTTVISSGYNTCTAGGVVRLERKLQVTY